MNNSQAIIHYLYHSGFSIETPSRFLIFDYWENDRNKNKTLSIEDGILYPNLFPNHKEIVVFASHNHHDHFDRRILDWGNERQDIIYVLSSDIKIKNPKNRCQFIDAYQTLTINGMAVKTFGSTDQGVSFLVHTDGLDIFHAGDLNMWYWYYESTQKELFEDKQKFIEEIDKMIGEHIDIAFFPVDPRLKEYYYLGGEHFIRCMQPDLFIPMHFAEEYPITERFAQQCNHLSASIVPIDKKGQKIIFSKKE